MTVQPRCNLHNIDYAGDGNGEFCCYVCRDILLEMMGKTSKINGRYYQID